MVMEINRDSDPQVDPQKRLAVDSSKVTPATSPAASEIYRDEKKRAQFNAYLARYRFERDPFIDQDNSKVCYAKKIEKKESLINWNEPAKIIVAKIRGLNPYPGIWFTHNKNRLKIIQASEAEKSGNIGEVLDENLTVGCGKGSLKIEKIQKEGKKILKAKEFLAGYKIKKGENLI